MPKGRLKGSKNIKKNVNNIDRVLKRFNTHFEKSGSCWEWISPIDCHGYGVFYMFGKTYKAHRAALILSGKSVADDVLVCHTCNNRRCVKIEHLYVGTHRDNMRDLRESGNLKGEKNPQFGKSWSDEEKQLISNKTKEAMKRPEIREKFLNSIKNRRPRE